MPEINKKKNVKLNYIYNLIYQIVLIITPLITAPYLSRVLGSAGIGQYSYTYSIVTYFTLIASFGFTIYAQREIARHQGDKQAQSKIFWEIFFARLLVVIASISIYFILILSGIYGKDYTLLMYIESIFVFAVAFDVVYLFQGNEEFGFIAIRNVVIKILGMALIFIFVKNESHVWLYVLCLAITYLLSNLSLWTKVPKMVVRVKLKSLEIKKHFKPAFKLFIPTLATSIYTILDKTLIGAMVPGTVIVEGVEKKIADIECGYYNQADTIIKTLMTILTSLSAVMIPRNSQLIASGNSEEFNRNIKGAMKFTFFVGCPIMFGIMAVSLNFSPWFFGEGYEKVPYLIMALSPLILIIGLSGVLGLQYLLPKKEDTKYTIAIVAAAVVNLIISLSLIYFLKSYGAVIGTVAAETVVTGVMFYFARKDIPFIKVIKDSWKPIVSSILMFGAVFGTQFALKSSIPNTIILVLEGIAIYFALLFILKDETLLAALKKMGLAFQKIKNKLKKSKQPKQ